MINYILDSSALIRYIDGEPGADRVNALLKLCASGKAGLFVSAVQWGETAGNLRKRFGASEQDRLLSTLLPSEASIVAVRGECAVRAAEIKVDRKMPYADAIALELAMSLKNPVLVTAHYAFKGAEDLATIEFLPIK